VGLDARPGEAWVAVGGEEVLRLDAVTLRPLGAPIPMSADPLCFTPQGDALLGARGRHVQVWNLAGREVARTVPPAETHSEENISGLAYGAGGALLLTASSSGQDRHLRLWDLAGGRQVAQLAFDGGRGKVAFA